MYNRGFNFSREKYKVIDDYTFYPHIRYGFRASIPYEIVSRFKEREISLLEISDKESRKIRIKKLYQESNSKTISLKAEKGLENPKVKVLDIISEKRALERRHMKEPFNQVIPKHAKTDGKTPTYSFDYGDYYILGGYCKKELVIKKGLEFDDNTLSAIGLYIADGGKTVASFTNSWPEAINCALSFLNQNFCIEREELKAVICCNPNINDKKELLEEYWSLKTGIRRFSDSLHFNKNVTCPQGIMELHFCSILLKEFMLGLITYVLESPLANRFPLINGLLSGDGSPIQQTKHVLNHQITYDEKTKPLLDKIFSKYKTRIVSTQPRMIVSPSWGENKAFLFQDAYCFNRRNNLRFAKRFLSLPSNQRRRDSDLEKFKEEQYPKLLNNLIEHYRNLEKIGLIKTEDFEDIIDEYNIC